MDDVFCRFLDNYFLLYGFNVYTFYSLPAEELKMGDINNPMCEAFPRVSENKYPLIQIIILCNRWPVVSTTCGVVEESNKALVLCAYFLST